MNARTLPLLMALVMHAFWAAGQTPSHHPQRDSLFLSDQQPDITALVHGLDAATVSALSDAPAAPLEQVQRLEVGALDATPAPSRLLALAALPGVSFQTATGGTVRPIVRGLSGLRVATYFYGARIETQAWGEHHGIYLPEQGIERVEVMRGASTLIDAADALGGVLRFVPIGPDAEQGRSSALHLTGHSNTSGYQASVITRKRSESAYHTFSGGVNRHGDATLPNGSRLDNSAYRQFFAQGRFGYLKRWGTWDGAYTSAYNTAGLIGRTGWHQSGDHLITNSLHIQGRRGWVWHPTLSYQLNHRKEYHDSLAVGEAESALLPDFDLSLRTTRLDLRVERKEGPWQWAMGTQGGLKTNENGPLKAGAQAFLPDAEIKEGGVFAQSGWQRGALHAVGILRSDVRQTQATGLPARTHWMGSGGVGITWESPRAWRMTLGLARKNRAPGLAELAASGIHGTMNRVEWGNADLRVETAHQIELNWTRPERNGRHAELSGYHQRVNGFIHLTETDTTLAGLPVFAFEQRNATLTGLEVSAGWAVRQGLELRAAGSWIDARDERGQILPLIPPANVRLEAHTFWGNGLGRTWRAQSIVRASREAVLLDAGCSVVWNANWTTTLTASNLLNCSYTTILSQLNNLGLPEPGRNIRVRLEWSF